jgi:hypothetical protein
MSTAGVVLLVYASVVVGAVVGYATCAVMIRGIDDG